MKLRVWMGDRSGNVQVGVICIALICVTFIVWLLTWTPVSMLIDVLRTMTDDPQALRIFSLANTSAGILLIGEIFVYVVWWLASSFTREDQTYYGGMQDA